MGIDLDKLGTIHCTRCGWTRLAVAENGHYEADVPCIKVFCGHCARVAVVGTQETVAAWIDKRCVTEREAEEAVE